MDKWGIIATWYFSKDGVKTASNLLSQGESASDALKSAINDVENNPRFKSVGYGGLPNQEGVCEFDAGWMNGDTLGFGAVGAARDIKNIINVAEKLSHEQFNAFLVGAGAEQYAKLEGFEQKEMLSQKAKNEYMKRKALVDTNQLTAYDGHDTVSMVCVDKQGTTISATSTSGLFMKKTGRVGDSPIIGSGYYADSDIGGVAATGVGEEIMKGCLSYEVTTLMEDGMSPMQACEMALTKFEKKLIKKRGKACAISIVAMNKDCEWGVATNVEFTFVVATHEQQATTYLANVIDGVTVIKEVSDTTEWSMKEEH
ncbi:MAG: N(4)-(beta-N-acetylglucosaminyl)-L-asparaginase, partial [Turicibacter sp.]